MAKQVTLKDLTRHYAEAPARLKNPIGSVIIGPGSSKLAAMRDVHTSPIAPPAIAFPAYKYTTRE
jgi:hypothetical protein